MHTADAREQMIEQQVRAWDVLEARVLEAMRRCRASCLCRGGSATARMPMSRCRWRADSICCVPAWPAALLQALLPQPGEAVLEDRGRQRIRHGVPARHGGGRSARWRFFRSLRDAARRNLAALGMRDVEVLDADALNADSGARTTPSR